MRRNHTNATLWHNQFQKTDEHNYARLGDGLGGDGKEAVRCLSYDVIFAYAVNAVQELTEFVKQQQNKIDEHNQKIDKLINIILSAGL